MPKTQTQRPNTLLSHHHNNCQKTSAICVQRVFKLNHSCARVSGGVLLLHPPSQPLTAGHSWNTRLFLFSNKCWLTSECSQNGYVTAWMQLWVVKLKKDENQHDRSMRMRSMQFSQDSSTEHALHIRHRRL